jgi:hypothetical protein
VISSFWSGLAGKVADRAALALVSPAFAFWTVGLLAWLLSANTAARRSLVDRLGVGGQVTQLLVIIVALLVVVCSGVVVQRLVPPVLLLLQGSWPAFAGPLRRRRVAHQFQLKERLEEQWQNRYQEVEAYRSASDKEQLLTADRLRFAAAEQGLLDAERRLTAYPPRSERVAPTRLGNLLAAAPGRVLDKYGIDAARCWPALWLILPEVPRTDVAEARKDLDDCVLWLIWSVLLLIWVPLSWWVLLLVVPGAWLSYLATVGAAARYGELIDAAYTVHRGLLYDSLGWPRPAASTETASGFVLTTAIWRGPALAEQLRPS